MADRDEDCCKGEQLSRSFQDDDTELWGDESDEDLLKAASDQFERFPGQSGDTISKDDSSNQKRKVSTPVGENNTASVKKPNLDKTGDPGQSEVSASTTVPSDRDAGTPDTDRSQSTVSSEVEVPLYTYRQGYLWVSDVTSQSWCEQQMVYNFTFPGEVVDRPEITAGSNIHLARELEVQDSITVNVTSNEDIFAIKLINLLGAVNSFLAGIPVRREIPVFGSPFDNDIFMVGLIDEIRCDTKTFDLDLIELKTRKIRQLPSKSQKEAHDLQVMLYKKLFDNLVVGRTNKRTVTQKMRLDLNKTFGDGIKATIKQEPDPCACLDQLFDRLTQALKYVPRITQCMIEYVYQDDQSTIALQNVEFKEEWLREKLDYYLSYWKGQREVVGVEIEEAWKCQRCGYADVCQWRAQKAKECQRKNSANHY